MPVTMSLDAGINGRGTALSSLRRVLLDANMNLADLAYQFKLLNGWPEGIRPEPSRIMHVDLDYIYDPNPKRQDENLGRLLDRVKAMGASTVYLTKPSPIRTATAWLGAVFPQPPSADAFRSVQPRRLAIADRANVRVYAWMPLLGFALPAGHPLAKVLALSAGGQLKQQGYARLSPYSQPARQLIRDLYEDWRAARVSTACCSTTTPPCPILKTPGRRRASAPKLGPGRQGGRCARRSGANGALDPWQDRTAGRFQPGIGRRGAPLSAGAAHRAQSVRGSGAES